MMQAVTMKTKGGEPFWFTTFRLLLQVHLCVCGGNLDIARYACGSCLESLLDIILKNHHKI